MLFWRIRLLQMCARVICPTVLQEKIICNLGNDAPKQLVNFDHPYPSSYSSKAQSEDSRWYSMAR